MARPLSVTDDQILDATQAAFMRLGPYGLTMSEIAREAGLSRAAITLRFGGVDELKRLLVERLAASFEAHMASITLERGASGLVAIAETLGAMLKGRDKFSNFMSQYHANINDPVMISMEQRRGVALRALVGQAMPATRVDRLDAVDAFMAHITGSMMHWQTSDHPDAVEFLRERTVNWVRLAGILDDDSKSGTGK